MAYEVKKNSARVTSKKQPIHLLVLKNYWHDLGCLLQDLKKKKNGASMFSKLGVERGFSVSF